MAKTGRNDLCSCGSGKKYKKCCFTKAAVFDRSPFYFKLMSVILISGLGIIVYSNTFYSPFHLDDNPSIVNNFNITDIHNLKNIWNYLPRRFLLYLSIALNYHFNQLNVFGYHIFNLAVHIVSALLVSWLMLLTLSTSAMKENKISQHAHLMALFAGLVFVSHPVQTEAVTYIVQRTASMAALFYVAALCFYVKARLQHMDQPSSSTWLMYYGAALITAIVAMFTKEIAITLPFMVLLYEFSFLRVEDKFNWKYTVPFLFFILIIPITMYLTESAKGQQMRGVAADTPTDISSMHYLLTQFRVMVTYLRLVFFPVNQNLDYDYPVYKSFFELPVVLSFLFLGSILIWAKYLFSKHRLIAFSIFWFFLSLLPESSLLPIKDVIFEHRLYLPLVGYSIFLVSGAYYLLGKNNIKGMVVVLTMIIAINSFLTYQRNKVWKDDFSLWSDVVSKSPHKARPYNNLGFVYYNRGDTVQALSDYNKALELNPRLAEGYYNRGLIYLDQGKSTQAMRDFNRAIEINPRYVEAYNNRGNIDNKQGNTDEAILDYNKAIAINPYSTLVYNNLGFVYNKQGKFSQAIAAYGKAIDLDPGFVEAYDNRGNAYFSLGDFDLAKSDYDKAIELNPQYALAYNNRAISYYQMKEYNKSWADVHEAQALGATANPNLLAGLQKATGMDK